MTAQLPQLPLSRCSAFSIPKRWTCTILHRVHVDTTEVTVFARVRYLVSFLYFCTPQSPCTHVRRLRASPTIALNDCKGSPTPILDSREEIPSFALNHFSVSTLAPDARKEISVLVLDACEVPSPPALDTRQDVSRVEFTSTEMSTPLVVPDIRNDTTQSPSIACEDDIDPPLRPQISRRQSLSPSRIFRDVHSFYLLTRTPFLHVLYRSMHVVYSSYSPQCFGFLICF